MANRRRFYKHVGVETVSGTEPSASVQVGAQATIQSCFKNKSIRGQYKITLDGKTLRTPARNDLHVSACIAVPMILI